MKTESDGDGTYNRTPGSAGALPCSSIVGGCLGAASSSPPYRGERAKIIIRYPLI
jgi:hypothetical protein